MGLFGIQAGEKVEMRDGVALGALVEEQVYNLGDLLERGGRVLAPTIRLRVPIRCNPPLMETLVINLLSNAAKYSPPGAGGDAWADVVVTGPIVTGHIGGGGPG